MSYLLKAVIKKIFPEPILKVIWKISKFTKCIVPFIKFKFATSTPQWLDTSCIELLYEKYLPPVVPEDPGSVEKIVQGRSDVIVDLIATHCNEIKTSLELGAGHGLINSYLQAKGIKTTAIDLKDEFDEKTREAGVNCQTMDACKLEFEDNSFDFLFSYDSIEHFLEPEKVLKEAIRVVKPGGYIYLSFSPIYMSPWGFHIYKCLPIPYSQFLFPYETITDYIDQNNLREIKVKTLNEWTIRDYRDLWKRYSNVLHVKFDHVTRNYSYLDLVKEYPSCFKSKTNCFEDFIIEGIKILFEVDDKK